MRLQHTLRLALYQFWLGAVSVLMLGTLNRILRVEMGLDLALVGITLGGAHYLAALVSIPIGHRSDTHPYLGYHRLPYHSGNISDCGGRFPRGGTAGGDDGSEVTLEGSVERQVVRGQRRARRGEAHHRRDGGEE